MNKNEDKEPIFRGIVYTGNWFEWFELLTEWGKALEEKENKKNEFG